MYNLIPSQNIKAARTIKTNCDVIEKCDAFDLIKPGGGA
jgi:hypothetical protein